MIQHYFMSNYHKIINIGKPYFLEIKTHPRIFIYTKLKIPQTSD